jgi:hypothetical protein
MVIPIPPWSALTDYGSGINIVRVHGRKGRETASPSDLLGVNRTKLIQIRARAACSSLVIVASALSGFLIAYHYKYERAIGIRGA